jgi:hypothetical protein
VLGLLSRIGIEWELVQDVASQLVWFCRGRPRPRIRVFGGGRVLSMFANEFDGYSLEGMTKAEGIRFLKCCV